MAVKLQNQSIGVALENRGHSIKVFALMVSQVTTFSLVI